MVSSSTRKIFSFAISLLVAVISLTTAATAATAPTVTALTRYTPGFAGAPGKMVRDIAGNFYVTDFWGKGIVKLDRLGNRIGFIATNGRPSAVAVLADNRLVVAVTTPQAKVSVYNQLGTAPAVTGEETSTVLADGGTAYFRPTAITVDAAGYIYVVDSGDSSNSLTVNVGKVKVYDSAFTYKYAFGARNASGTAQISTVGGEFMQPMGIAYEKVANHIVVADTMNSRLQYFTAYNGTSCTYVKSVGASMNDTPSIGSNVTFGDPTDVAFEYTDANVLSRLYVTERGRNEVSVVDAVSTFDLTRITGSTGQNYVTPVTGATMKFPSGVIFEKTGATGVGVLYVDNAPTNLAANILPLGIGGGTVPVPSVTLTITSSVPATVTSSPLVVSGTTSPATAVSCSVNGGSYTAATGTASWSVSLNLALDATNYIVCKSGNAFAEARTFYTATLGTAPTVVISSGAGITKNATVTVSGTSNAANANVHLANALNSAVADTTTAADGTWSAVIALAEGSNSITPTIWKTGTAVGTGIAITVISDSIAPSATIAFLSNGRVTASAVQNIDGIIQDANLATVEVNGDQVPAAAMVTSGTNTYFSMPVTLIRGSNTVTVKATDLAGNSATVTRTVTLNPDLMAFTVALPGSGSYLPGVASAPASGAADAFYTSVDAAGSPVSPTAGAWSTAAFTLSAGIKGYEFTATNGVKTATEKRTIINSASNAQLAITSPAADIATNQPSVLIQGSVAANSPTTPTITVNGVTQNVSSYTQATGEFSHTVTLAGQGANVVKVTADGTTSAVRNIIYDTVAPEFAIEADSKPAPVTISGSLEPSAKISAISAKLLGANVNIPLSVISYDPYDVATDSVVWHANLAGYTYDSISFTAVDPAGNSSLLAYSGIVPTGDVDGDGSVRLADALAALRHVALTQLLTGNPFDQADVGALVENRAGRDGKVDIADAVLILKKAYGLLNF